MEIEAAHRARRRARCEPAKPHRLPLAPFFARVRATMLLYEHHCRPCSRPFED